jgi:hypothetical protein
MPRASLLFEPEATTNCRGDVNAILEVVHTAQREYGIALIEYQVRYNHHHHVERSKEN